MYAALACDTVSGHKPTAVTTLKIVINKHMQRDNVDYAQCRYHIYTPYYNGTSLRTPCAKLASHLYKKWSKMKVGYF